MNNEIMARRGRVLLWGLVGYVAIQGVIGRYLVPHELYMQITRSLAGAYADQELVLAQHPWTDGIHRLLGLTMLVLGMLQFDAGLRRSRPLLHRWTGRGFLLIAFIIGATGLIMGLGYPFSGLQEQVFVVAVSALLLWFASMAWTEVRRRQFAEHREWMIRALGLSFCIAVQRVYYAPLWLLTGLPEQQLFALSACLAVLTGLFVAERWIRRTRIARFPYPQGEPA